MIAIIAGIVILAFPNILEILIAIFLIVIGLVGLVGSMRK
ncbi:MAG: DUF3096 domain-containing protein [Candidatus Woesearchaeota archaeon]